MTSSEKQQTNTNNTMEETIKELIAESLRKRLEGQGDIDNLQDNETLINHWVTAIVALGYNDCDVEAATADINEIQEQMFGPVSIEDTRAFVFLASNRFSDEIAAFQKYVELRDSESDDAILYAVKEELKFVEEGDFMLS